MEHSILSPSSMARISVCGASVPMQRAVPEIEVYHEVREVGTAVHEINALDLVGKPVSPGYKTSNGIIITQEMMDRGKIYTDFCRSVTGEAMVEEQIDCKSIHPECFGTADFWSYDNARNHMTVVDYKDGYINVDPFENAQAITYASGAIDLVTDGGCNGLENNMTVDIVIIQPRSGGIKTWSTRATHLRPFINRISHACHQALGDNPVAVAGEHCKYCSARGVCKSLDGSVNNFIALADSVPAVPNLGMEYEFLQYGLKLLNSRLTAIEAEMFHNPPEGYEVTTGRGTKRWDDEQKAKDTARLFGVDIEKAPALITPIQATAAGIPKEIIDTLSTLTPGKPVLKKIDMDELKTAFKQEN